MVKKFMLISLTCMVAVLIFSNVMINKPISISKNSLLTVVIDPGHGGIDGGVIGVKTKAREADLNLFLSKNLADCFLAGGINPVLTRTTDVGLYGSLQKGFKSRDLIKRVEIGKNAQADLFISIHMNKFSDSRRRGAQVFYQEGSSESQKLAGYIQNQLNGLKESVKLTEPLVGDYYLLNNNQMPSVIVECGFLSNLEDERLLTSQNYRQIIAHAIYSGVINYLSDTN